MTPGAKEAANPLSLADLLVWAGTQIGLRDVSCNIFLHENLSVFLFLFPMFCGCSSLFDPFSLCVFIS